MKTISSDVLGTFFKQAGIKGLSVSDKTVFSAFKNLVFSFPNPVFCKSSDGRYICCNQAWAQICGKEPDALVSCTDFDVFPARVANRFFQWDSELLKTGESQRIETRVPDADGTERSLVLSRSVLKDAAGELIGVLGTALDITESKREERERSASMVMAAAAEMAIQTIEGMIDPVIILNSVGVIERVNRGYAELFGLGRSVLGHDLSSVLYDVPDEECLKLLSRCRDHGRIRDLSAHVTDATGRTVPVLVNISTLRDSQKAIDGFIVAIRDVSSVLDANEKLDAILNASEDAVYLVDAGGKIQAGNRAMAERYNERPENLPGLALDSLPDVDLNDMRRHFLDTIVSSGKPTRLEYEWNNKVFCNSGFPVFDSAGKVHEVAVFSYDITEQKQGERLQRALYSISEAAYFAHDMQNLFRIVHRIVARLIPADSILIVLKDHSGTNLECPYYIEEGHELSDSAAGEVALSDGLVDYMMKGGTSLLLKPKDIDRLVRAGIVSAKARSDREWLGVPLRTGEGAVIGALVVQTGLKSGSYGESDRKILTFVSSQIAMAIERKSNEEELRSKNTLLKTLTDGTILALVKAVELRDPYTAGHQQRVSRLAGVLAKTMGLGAEQIEATRIAALLHDVGKISVPSELLSKPGQLSDLEYQLIRQHPVVSSDILRSIDFPYPISRYVLEHHEKIDGSGYPAGLKGEEICLESRIICVADVVDAMVSHRPYRPSRGLELALEELEHNAGSLYDKDVTSICAALFRSGDFDFDMEAPTALAPWRV